MKASNNRVSVPAKNGQVKMRQYINNNNNFNSLHLAFVKQSDPQKIE
jgi:hypothetical protein